MTKYDHTDFARDLANQMVKERFGTAHGVESFDEYLDLTDERQTQHLAGGCADRVIGTAGKQRRAIRLSLEGAATVILRVPMNDPRRSGAKVWAETALADWLDLIENGADGSWYLMYKSNTSTKGYVQTGVPLSGDRGGKTVPIGRLITGAGPGRITRFHDRNPLNLRRTNLFIMGNPNTVEGTAKGAKHDSRALMAERAAQRRSLAGAGFDIPATADSMDA